jgi:uncharacterized membrane protein YgdD (TMEM256/DUF423 family)
MKPVTHGALQAFLAVLAGAFGAHGLQSVLDDYGLRVWHTAVEYHLAHALALVLLGALEERINVRGAHRAFGAGILLFSGSLYALALTRVKALGMITPFGGLAFLTGWLLLALASRRSTKAAR